MTTTKIFVALGFGLLILVLAALVFWLFSRSQAPAPPSETPVTRSESLGGQIIEKAQNPVQDNIPEINPFQTQVNPFEDLYVNPFK